MFSIKSQTSLQQRQSFVKFTIRHQTASHIQQRCHQDNPITTCKTNNAIFSKLVPCIHSTTSGKSKIYRGKVQDAHQCSKVTVQNQIVLDVSKEHIAHSSEAAQPRSTYSLAILYQNLGRISRVTDIVNLQQRLLALSASVANPKSASYASPRLLECSIP